MSVDVSDVAPVLGRDFQPDPSTTIHVSRTKSVRNAATMIVLFLVNLLNFMDRFAVAGVLDKIQVDFKIDDAQAGLLQTVFVCSYMVLSPLFGYLGDRYSRKLMIILGVSLWSMTTLAGSFVPKHLFWLFMLLRGLVGVGEASYSCVASTIIADMYKHDKRTNMLAIFNTAVPLGGGLGYIVGSYVSKAFNGNWRWALRVTPPLGLICVVLMIKLVQEPARGSADGAPLLRKSDWFYDVRQICRIKSFILTTLGFTWVAFAMGSLAWWAPKYLQDAYVLYYGKDGESKKANVNLYFGIITCVAGLVGVFLGSEIAKRYRKRNARADPIVCGVAVLLSIPFLVVALLFSKDNLISTWICIFLAETFLSTNWALISDMLMYIIIPSRRATASSIQIFIMHLLGDASSPYLVGITSDAFLKGRTSDLARWSSLRNGLLLTPCVATLGGIAFLFSAIFIVHDRRHAEIDIESMQAEDQFRMDESYKI